VDKYELRGRLEVALEEARELNETLEEMFNDKGELRFGQLAHALNLAENVGRILSPLAPMRVVPRGEA
jgi:hypothetical protein